MSTIIKDGTGTGYSAKVTDGSQLLTQTESRSIMFHRSFEHSSVFTFAQVAEETMTASTENILCHITNTSTTDLLCISHIHVSGYEAHGFARVYVASAYSSGGATYTPGNHNRTSGAAADATVYVNSSGLSVTGGAQVCTSGLSPETTTAVLTFSGSILLGHNNTLDVRFREMAGATPSIALCVEGFYVHTHH